MVRGRAGLRELQSDHESKRGGIRSYLVVKEGEGARGPKLDGSERMHKRELRQYRVVVVDVMGPRR